MVFVRLLEIAGVIGLAWFIITQMILPAVYDRKLFPLFHKTGELEKELIEAKQDGDDARLAKEVEQEKSKTAEIKAVKEEVKDGTQQ